MNSAKTTCASFILDKINKEFKEIYTGTNTLKTY